MRAQLPINSCQITAQLLTKSYEVRAQLLINSYKVRAQLLINSYKVRAQLIKKYQVRALDFEYFFKSESLKICLQSENIDILTKETKAQHAHTLYCKHHMH